MTGKSIEAFGQDRNGLDGEATKAAVGAADAPNPCFTTPNPILEGVELREAYARIREALEPFARIAGPINGEEGQPTYLEAIEGKEPTGELYLGSHFGSGREETLWADDFRRAAEALKATPLIGLSQGEGDRARARELLIAEVAAKDPAEADRIRNVPAIVANQDVFWEAAIRAIVAALSTVQDGPVREEGV